MWTCGIDMATQQATPAMLSSTVSAFGDRPSGRSGFAATVAELAVLIAGGRLRSTRARLSITTMQKMPTPM